jgi:Transmembrane amino acid transporter protein
VSRITVTAAVTVPLILLSWVRSFRELTIFTAIGVIVLVISIFVILIDGLRETTGEIIENTPLFLPIGKTLSFIGPATFCYTIHYCVLAMGAEGLVCVKNEKILYSDQSKIKKGREIVSEESKKLNPVSLHTKSSSLSDDNYDDKYDIFIVGDMNDEDETIKEDKNSDCGGDTQIMTSISKGNIDILNKNMNIDINMNMNMNVSVTDFPNEIINIHETVSEIPLFPQINETLSESPKRKLQSVLTDISNPLGTAYLLTSILNITFGGVGYAFYRESEIIR